MRKEKERNNNNNSDCNNTKWGNKLGLDDEIEQAGLLISVVAKELHMVQARTAYHLRFILLLRLMFAETNHHKKKFYAVRRVSREALDRPIESQSPRIERVGQRPSKGFSPSQKQR